MTRSPSAPPTILFRKCQDAREELPHARKYFSALHNRTECWNRLVVPRYSSLPHHRELEEDLAVNGCRLVNTTRQHKWVADFEYYGAIRDFTPETWTQEEYPFCGYDGPVVVKGKTNSMKRRWNTRMLAEGRAHANQIGRELSQDSLIGEQDLIYRRYVPLKTFEVSRVNGQPFANEWRFFYLGTTRIGYGYYWAIADDLSRPYITDEGFDLADRIAQVAAEHVNFFAIDVAETEAGHWTVVEINDGTMSGLATISPDEFYKNLGEALKTWQPKK